MEIWIPKKHEIENIVRNLADRIKESPNIKDIEEEVDGILSGLQCYVANRADVEKSDCDHEAVVIAHGFMCKKCNKVL